MHSSARPDRWRLVGVRRTSSPVLRSVLCGSGFPGAKPPNQEASVRPAREPRERSARFLGRRCRRGRGGGWRHFDRREAEDVRREERKIVPRRREIIAP